jgi:microcystin-dependent protein
MAEPFIAEIKMFGANFAPRGYAFCSGQTLSIAQNTALFSLLGTTYGGNGVVTFALPNLQGRFPMHAGPGPGLTPRTLGEMGGSETVTLVATQMPAHSHAVQLPCSADDGTIGVPTGAVPAVPSAASPVNAYAPSGSSAMAAPTVGTAGGNQPHDNVPPYLVVNFIIALDGIFPSRN